MLWLVTHEIKESKTLDARWVVIAMFELQNLIKNFKVRFKSVSDRIQEPKSSFDAHKYKFKFKV